MNGKSLLYSIIASIGGLILGYNVAVLFITKSFISEYYHLAEATNFMFLISTIPGYLVGALTIGRLADKFGRRFMLITLGCLFFICALGNVFATNVILFSTFHLICGIAIGGTSVLSPLYISEISPKKSKTIQISLFPVFALVGILIGFVISLIVTDFDLNKWRLILGIEAFFSILFIVFLYFVPRSPNWLISIGLHGEAYLVLSQINPDLKGDEIDDLVNEMDEPYE